MELDFKCPERNRLRTVLCMPAEPDAGALMALTHHLLTPKFEVEGIVIEGGKKEMGQKTEQVLKLLGDHGRCPVYFGASSVKEDKDSEGSAFIRSCCKTESPLYVNVLGGLTTAAAAYVGEPEQCPGMTVIWAGGAPWPGGGPEKFMAQDIDAANELWGAGIPFWQIPRDTYQRICISGAELERRIQPHGALGAYLAECAKEEITRRGTYTDALILPQEAVFAALFNPFDHSYECRPAPRINHEMYYVHNQHRKPIRVYYFLDSRMILEDLFAKLEILYGEGGEA